MEWLHGGKMAIFYVADMQRETIDLYIDTHIQLIQQWPVETPFLEAVVAQGMGIFLTPYMRKRSLDAAHISRSRNAAGRIAVIVQKNPMLTIVQAFVKSIYHPKRDRIEPQLFFSQEEGVAWLEALLEPNS